MNLMICTLPKLGFTPLYLKNSKNIEIYYVPDEPKVHMFLDTLFYK